MLRVRFNGNGDTSSARSSDFCLLRSAELCKNNGYKYFIIIDESKGVSQSQFTSPTTTKTKGSATAVGDYVYGSATSTTYGGQTYIISRSSNENTIICFSEKPEQGISYNADFIYKSIRKQYSINSSSISQNSGSYSGLREFYAKEKKTQKQNFKRPIRYDDMTPEQKKEYVKGGIVWFWVIVLITQIIG